jgi:hypothetical protein
MRTNLSEAPRVFRLHDLDRALGQITGFHFGIGYAPNLDW